MLLNTAIFNQTVETAKAKSANNPAMLRAIDRAVYEINRSKYWSFADGVLRIQSTTSRKLYVVDDAHTCEARGICKHKAARRLMIRYTEALGVAVAEAAIQRQAAQAAAPVAETKRAAVIFRMPDTLKGEKYCGVDI